ncbi:MAG: prolipoprotein diacylglyceryl transferase [Myxococcota bacterium]|nr:prolipoprotein diacylglyceryl transferase [Myxococcota bacterium]
MYPILFKIPVIDLPIYSYGVMLGLSLVVGWYIVMYLGGRDGFPKQTLVNCYVWTAISAIAGSRILYILTNLNDFQDAGLIDMVNVRKGGLVAYGGFIGGFLGSWIYLKRARIRLLPWADIVVPTLGSGLGITRIGCFLYGCDYGQPIPDHAPGWVKAIGVVFPNWQLKFPDIAAQFERGMGCMQGSFHGAPAFHHHVSMKLVEAHAHTSALVYPTQLMEILNGWFAFGLALFVRRHTRFRGQAFLAFTAYYGITRALMETLRGDTQRGGIGLLSTSQIIGISTFVVAMVAWIMLSKRAKKDPQAAMDLGPGAGKRDEKTATNVPQPVTKTRSKHRKKK